jgi:hypothetical protein
MLTAIDRHVSPTFYVSRVLSDITGRSFGSDEMFKLVLEMLRLVSHVEIKFC